MNEKKCSIADEIYSTIKTKFETEIESVFIKFNRDMYNNNNRPDSALYLNEINLVRKKLFTFIRGYINSEDYSDEIVSYANLRIELGIANDDRFKTKSDYKAKTDWSSAALSVEAIINKITENHEYYFENVPTDVVIPIVSCYEKGLNNRKEEVTHAQLVSQSLEHKVPEEDRKKFVNEFNCNQNQFKESFENQLKFLYRKYGIEAKEFASVNVAKGTESRKK